MYLVCQLAVVTDGGELHDHGLDDDEGDLAEVAHDGVDEGVPNGGVSGGQRGVVTSLDLIWSPRCWAYTCTVRIQFECNSILIYNGQKFAFLCQYFFYKPFTRLRFACKEGNHNTFGNTKFKVT